MERTEDRFSPGRLVESTAGRDSGNFFIVLERLNENMVLVVDGEGRRMSSPKKKNVKHLRVHPEVSEEFSGKVLMGHRVTDADVRKVLHDLVTIRAQSNL